MISINDSKLWAPRLAALRPQPSNNNPSAVAHAGAATAALSLCDFLSDVTFAIGETKIRAHRVMLAAHSPHWRRVFEEDPVSSAREDIPLSHALAPFQQLLEYCYSG